MRFKVTTIIFVAVISFSSFGQVPTLDPTQTVNPATGEMSFSLPLATVKGINGHDFPIALNYKAGILYHQPASVVGLGFSLGAGAITRKVVFVPDDNSSLTSYSETYPQNCYGSSWPTIVSWIVTIVVFVVGLIITYFCPPAGFAVMWASSVIQMASTFITLSLVSFSSNNYNSGGFHDPVYNYDIGKGLGYFHNLSAGNSNYGKKHDLPDIYFINTPYISGQMVCVSSSGDIHHFVLTQTTGYSGTTQGTVDIVYNSTIQEFTITLADGTKLFLGGPNATDKESSVFNMSGSKTESSYDCEYAVARTQNEAVPVTWWLREVRYNDFVDGSNPSGSWIKFDYSCFDGDYNFQSMPMKTQASLYDKNYSLFGIKRESAPLNLSPGIQKHYVLNKIITPKQTAEFCYTYDRLDDVWLNIQLGSSYNSSFEQLSMGILDPNIVAAKPVLRKIQLLNLNHDEDIKLIDEEITFNTDYSLRQSMLNSIASTKGCLTLKSISSKMGEKQKWWVRFDYPENKNYAGFYMVDLNQPDGQSVHLSNPPKGPYRHYNNKAFLIEEKDLWGYFCQNPGPFNATEGGNDFNSSGLKTKAMDADAWSLNKIYMPNGATIEWEYEPNRYDNVNNQPVSNPSNTPNYKFGGGIRVSKIKIGNGVDPQLLTKRYIYTNKEGDFVEKNTNCSGYSTAEPCPYISIEDAASDPRSVKGRGGLYVPAKVAYEMVQVIDGYVEPTTAEPNGKAPNGYTVYKTFTPADPGCQNEGDYGEIDNSFSRGFYKEISQYSSKNILRTKKELSYDVTNIMYYPFHIYNDQNARKSLLPYLKMGTVRIKKDITTIDNVSTTTEYQYGDDINTDKVDSVIYQLPTFIGPNNNTKK